MLKISNNPLVTVAVPTLNRPDFIIDTLKSIIAQTYDNLEIIISDNGSKNDVKALVKKFLDSDSRIVLYRNDETLPPAVHFNQCLDRAKGEYFVIICDDDFISENFIEELVNGFIKYPNVTLGLTLNKQIDECSQVQFTIPSVDWETINGYTFLNNWLNGFENVPVASFISHFAKTSLLKQSGGFPDFLHASHTDNASAINLALQGDVLFVKNAIFSYRVYKNSFGLRLKYKALAVASHQFIEYFIKNETISAIITSEQKSELVLGIRRLCLDTYLTRLINIYNLSGFSLIKAVFEYKLRYIDFIFVFRRMINYLYRVFKNA